MSSELGIFYRSEVSAGPHLLVAAERNLYAMKLSGAACSTSGTWS